MSDLDRSIRIYRELPGCEVSAPGRASTLRACDPRFMHVCLKVADVEQVVYVRDPDRVVLELVEEPPGVVLEDIYFPAG